MIEKSVDLKDFIHTTNLFGSFDENIILIENEFNVKIALRDQSVKIIGEEDSVEKTISLIGKLQSLANNEEVVTKHVVKYMLNLIRDEKFDEVDDFNFDFVVITHKGKQINVKTNGQRDYINSIKAHDIVFCIGPAGTGKTFLAVAMAINSLRNRIVDKIIISRPVVEAGEKLGFLPGDLQEKVDPYIRPIYDSLNEILGQDTQKKLLTKGVIEIAPLAYMRGRTLNNAFIILDEAQNTTPEQMKMFLTRMGIGSKVVITGDITQIDLKKGVKSGLEDAVKVLKGIERISFKYLTSKDVVRHDLVQKIINAYDKIGKKVINSFTNKNI